MSGRFSTWRRVYLNETSPPFWGAHLAALILVPLSGFSWKGVLWTALAYLTGMFFVTGGYHRYFSHRTYKTSRVFQFVLAWGAQITSQKGILWWAANHRHHHKYSDRPEDAHSTVQRGFWWAHMGWFLSDEFRATNHSAIRDLERYPELRLLNHGAMMFVPGISYAVICYLVAGTFGLAYGAFLPLVLIWHGTYSINSLAHMIGKKTYDAGDESKNSLGLAIVTMGEGWHNNHHYYQRSCRQGFHWYQIDLTYYILWVLSKVGIVWDIHNAPAHVVEGRPNDKRQALSAQARDAKPARLAA